MVQNVHATAAVGSLYHMKIDRAIEFKGVNEKMIEDAWKNWIQNDRFSIFDRSCVHSIIHILKSVLNDVCPFNNNVQYPFPKTSYEEIVQIGEDTNLGRELEIKEMKRIEDKIHHIADQMRAKKAKDNCRTE